MIKVINSFLPFRGFVAMTVFPFIFIRRDCVEKMKARGTWEVMLNHESIHGCQQLEMLFVGFVLCIVLCALGCGVWSLLCIPMFFWWYLLEWFVRLIFCSGNAYKNISFEVEAYLFEDDADYVYRRRCFSWLRYV